MTTGIPVSRNIVLIFFISSSQILQNCVSHLLKRKRTPLMKNDVAGSIDKNSLRHREPAKALVERIFGVEKEKHFIRNANLVGKSLGFIKRLLPVDCNHLNLFS